MHKTKCTAPPPSATTAESASLPKYLTSEAMAEMLSCSPRFVQLLAQRGEIPSLRVGKKLWRFEAEAVLAALGGKGLNS
jgi:excisionase family DNA binding protein